MTRSSYVLATCLVALVASSANAQPHDKDWGQSESDKKAALITVSGFSPSSGQVGTTVTIQGRGFTARTQILIGGQPVQATATRPDALMFKVPPNHGDGAIVLRHPGVARDVPVGMFQVAAAVAITRFTPKAGIRGSRVEITGSGFQQGDRVLMNGKELVINQLAPKRIVVTIPEHASSDYLTVVAVNGGQARTDAMFQVQMPAPIITTIAPVEGMPGTHVRMSGQNLTPADLVSYGKYKAEIASRGPDHVEVIVPGEARVDEFFTLQNANGQARSPQKFTLHEPAIIARISPAAGKVGDTIQIFGNHFRAGDRVSLGNVELAVEQLRPTQIVARIAQGAESGPVVLERGSVKVSSRQKLEVLYAPIIQSFSPEGGKPGSKVTLTGQHFGKDAVVYYGNNQLRILGRQGNHTMIVGIPKNASDQPFRVRTKAGVAISQQPFQIHVFPVVTGVSPRQGFPGTRITLHGKNLGSVHAVTLDDVALTIVSKSPTQLQADIPPGARSGRIKVQSFGTWLPSKLGFEVLAAPVITSFTPQAGPPGTELVIEGTGFTPETVILFEKAPLAITRRENGRLVVRIHGEAKPGKGYLFARNGLSETHAPAQFHVTAPAEITGFSPESVEAGAKVVIQGRNFDMTTRVFWGDVNLPVIQVGAKGKRIEVQVPDRAVGARYLIVDNGGVRVQSASMLEVRTPAPKQGNGVKVRDNRKTSP